MKKAAERGLAEAASYEGLNNTLNAWSCAMLTWSELMFLLGYASLLLGYAT